MPEIFRVIQITLDQDQAVSAVTALADADTAEIVRKLASNAAVQRRESGGVDQLANGPGGVMLQMSARAMSREQAIHLLLNEGLASAYARLGIEKDPAATAAELLRVVSATWANDLSDDELAAIETTCQAMDRIAQIRAREPKTGD